MKGLHTILSEHGINTANMWADDMRVVLSNHDDFVNGKTPLEHYLHRRGFPIFGPNFTVSSIPLNGCGLKPRCIAGLTQILLLLNCGR